MYQIQVHILSLLLVLFFPSNWPVEIITESSNLLCQRSLLTYGTVLTDYTFEKTEGDFF